MIPTLLSFVKENRGFADEFGIFEIGHTVDGLRADGTCNEQNKLGVALYSKISSEEALFLRLRDVALEITSNLLHKEASFESCETDFDYQHPTNTFALKVDGTRVGTLSVPHPTVLANIDKKCAVAFLEIETEKFASVPAAKNSYAEPSKFPSIDIDLTFTASVSELDFPSVRKIAFEKVGEALVAVNCKDIYEKDGVSSVTLRFTFSSREKTLSKQELTPHIDLLIESLAPLGLTFKA